MKNNTPRSLDVTGEYLLYAQSMTCVFLTDAKLEVRSVLRLLLQDLEMEAVGEAADLPAALVIVLISYLDARHQAAVSAGADTFISKGEFP